MSATEAREALRRYGRHDNACAVTYDKPCDCGLEVALAALPDDGREPCRDCGGTGIQRAHVHTPRCLDPVRRAGDCDKADLDRILAEGASR